MLQVVDPALRERDVVRLVEARGDGAAAHEVVATGRRAVGIGNVARIARPGPDVGGAHPLLVVTGLGRGTAAGDAVGSGTHSVEQVNAAAEAELNAQTVMSARAATPTAPTISRR